jgi:hypothetical protein
MNPADDSDSTSQEDAPLNTCPTLSTEDQEHLQNFESMRHLLRDRVRSVAQHYHVGCYITGRPGSSKTFTVVEELARLGTPWTLRNSRMSAAGLYELLHEHPEHTVVIDDVPSVLADKQALQILMAAMGGAAGKPRPVTYTTKDVRNVFDFHGGIVAVSNVPLRRDPLADALQSRVPLLEHEPTDAMLASFMRHRAGGGFEDLSPCECREVVEFVIAESAACDYRLDLRSMSKGLQDFRIVKHGKTHCCWRDLIRSGLKKIVKSLSGSQANGRAAEALRDQELARELFGRYPGAQDKAARDQAWQTATGKSVDQLYRRRRQSESDPNS